MIEHLFGFLMNVVSDATGGMVNAVLIPLLGGNHIRRVLRPIRESVEELWAVWQSLPTLAMIATAGWGVGFLAWVGFVFSGQQPNPYCGLALMTPLVGLLAMIAVLKALDFRQRMRPENRRLRKFYFG